MKKGIFICCSDRRTSFHIEKLLREELNLRVKEIINDPAMVDEESETVIYIDKGDLPSDYSFKGHNIFILTEGMDFNRWEKFNARGILVIKIDPVLAYLKEELAKIGYEFGQRQIVEDVELKPHLAGDKLESKEGIVGVYSVKDGIGKTTVALNLAGYIKETSPGTRVLLLDLDSQFSGIKNFIKNNVGVSEISLGVQSILEKMNRKVFRFNKLDLFIMPSNDKDEKPDDIVEMLTELKRHFDLIIIDSSSLIDEKSLTILNCISTLFLVSDNRSYIKEETANFVNDILPKMGINIPELYIVVNKSTSIQASTFEDKYRLKVISFIEFDTEVYEYEERKLIYGLGNKKSSMNDCIQKMAKTLGADTQQKAKKKFQDIFQ